MANTPFDDLGTEEILSTRISGIQDAVKNIEQSLNMDTEAVSEESLTLLADAMGRYRIAEAVGKRNWLDDPAPVIEQYIGGTWTKISTGFTIDYAGGAVIFADDKVGEQFRASFTRVKSTSGYNSHLSESAIHKTSDVIRTETNTQLKVEVVSSSVSETPDAGRIIFDTSQGKFFGGNGMEWV